MTFFPESFPRRAIDTALSQMEKQFGKGALLRLGSRGVISGAKARSRESGAPGRGAAVIGKSKVKSQKLKVKISTSDCRPPAMRLLPEGLTFDF